MVTRGSFTEGAEADPDYSTHLQSGIRVRGVTVPFKHMLLIWYFIWPSDKHIYHFTSLLSEATLLEFALNLNNAVKCQQITEPLTHTLVPTAMKTCRVSDTNPTMFTKLC
jgi:hypothetical protein